MEAASIAQLAKTFMPACILRKVEWEGVGASAARHQKLLPVRGKYHPLCCPSCALYTHKALVPGHRGVQRESVDAAARSLVVRGHVGEGEMMKEGECRRRDP